MATELAVGVKLIEALKRNNWLNISHFRRLLPWRCVLCAAPTPDAAVCVGCVEDLPWRKHTRVRASGKLERHASFHYRFPVVELVGRGKLGGDPGLMRLLGELMAQRPPVRASDVDAVCAVPLPYWRGVRRGYNQAREIARPLAASLRLPLVEALNRPDGGSTQRGLGRTERLHNLAGRFRPLPGLAGKRLLLVDDVTTTGATLREAARALYRGGAISVVAWTSTAVD